MTVRDGTSGSEKIGFKQAVDEIQRDDLME